MVATGDEDLLRVSRERNCWMVDIQRELRRLGVELMATPF